MIDPSRPIHPPHVPGVTGYLAWYVPGSAYAEMFKAGTLTNQSRHPSDIYATPEAAALAVWLNDDHWDGWADYLVVEVACVEWVEWSERSRHRVDLRAVREVGSVGDIVRGVFGVPKGEK